MKVVTIHLDEPVYREFQVMAKQSRRTTSELIREAMEAYRERIQPVRQPLWQSAEPARAGRVLAPWSGRSDLLDDYLSRS